jgi:hypothetical protein
MKTQTPYYHCLPPIGLGLQSGFISKSRGSLFGSSDYLVCTEVASLVETECEIKGCFNHDTIIWLPHFFFPPMKKPNVLRQGLGLHPHARVYQSFSLMSKQ